MCGCGSAAVSGAIGAEVYVATPNRGEIKEFDDKATADAYVAALGGGTVQTKQLQASA